jgi:hypothetical protein
MVLVDSPDKVALVFREVAVLRAPLEYQASVERLAQQAVLERAARQAWSELPAQAAFLASVGL